LKLAGELGNGKSEPNSRRPEVTLLFITRPMPGSAQLYPETEIELVRLQGQLAVDIPMAR